MKKFGCECFSQVVFLILFKYFDRNFICFQGKFKHLTENTFGKNI